MKYCFLLASMSTRVELLNKFIESAKKSRYRDADYYLYFQQITNDEVEYDKSFFKDIYVSHTRDGCCFPRMYWLNILDNYDYYIIIDDDMEFLGDENFDIMMQFSGQVKNCGIIVGDAKREMRFYEKAKPSNTIKVKNISFIEGGAVFRKEIRDLFVKEIPMQRLSYDGFTITTYINGYTNYKSYQSLILHKVTTGNQGFQHVRRNPNEFVSWYEKYIKQPRYDDGDIKLPTSERGLTDEAIQMHIKNRK